MADILIQEGVTFHSILRQKFAENIERLTELRKFSVNTYGLFNNFSAQISKASGKFFHKLKSDEEEDQSIIFLSKYVIDIMNELSKKVNSMSKKIENEIMDPLSQYIENHQMSQKVILHQSEELVYTLESNNDFLKELSKNFDLNQKEENTSQDKDEFRQIYEMEMEKCNQKWEQIKTNYHQIMNKIDIHNSSRCNFTIKQQLLFVEEVNRLVASSSVENSLREYKDLNCETSSLSIAIKDEIRQKLGNINLLEEKPMQSIDLTLYSKNSTISNEKRIIDDFVSIFTSKSNIKEETKDFQEARGLILEKIEWIKYFLNKMKSSLHTQIHLPIVKYRELTALIKYIFAYAAEIEENQSILYNILYVSYRVKYNDEYLIKDIGKYEEYWQNQEIWFKVMAFIKTAKYSYKKVQAQSEMGSSKNISRKRYPGLFFAKDIWQMRKVNRVNQQKKIKSQRVILDARDYDIMCEINYFMVKLELEETFVFNFILEARKRYDLSKESVKKLISYHNFHQITNNNKIGSSQIKRKKRLQKKYNSITCKDELACLCVGKCLQYFSLTNQDITRLRLVSRYWAKNLQKRIYERYLIEAGESMSAKTRLVIYRQVTVPPFSESVYQRMVKQMPMDTQHNQIIYLDAKRSLSWDESLRPVLMEVLNVFAYYHNDVGYLQGMNYLCENILKLTANPFEVYCMFEHLMNKHYIGMYTGTFDGLKVKIYQMMRIIQRENPKLYHHFMTEKIEGEHFLLSWAITLWGEMTGELCWVLWDGFLVKGWKWWFKTTLWLLRSLEPQLLEMNFEEMMKCFSDLGSSLFCLDLNQLGAFGIHKNKIKLEIDKIRIESDILRDIEKQYQMKITTMDKYLKQIDNPKRKS